MNIKRIANLKGLGSKTGIASLALLALVGIGMVCPIVGEEASAEELDINHEMVASVRTDTTAYVRSSIAISLTGEAELDLTPTSQGVFSESNDLRLSITTNNTSGYEVYLTTGDNTSTLSQKSPANGEGEIKPVSGTMNATNYTSHLDSWGYNISSSSNTNAELTTAAGEFVAIPTNGSGSIVKTDASTSDDSYILKFGASISPSLPAGVYTNTVVASVVANPLEVRSLSDITTMQEMTPEICAISFENETKQLTDSRDGKSYWVAKLADGNCWMTQNLALDIYNDNGIARAIPDGTDATTITDANTQNFTILSRDNTNIDSDSVDLESTTIGTRFPESDNANSTKSVNIGNYVLSAPEDSDGCNAIHYNENIDNCKRLKLGEKGDDQHYSIGNYYQWNTAVAGTGNNTMEDGEKIEYSICPKNWRLPRSGTIIASDDGSNMAVGNEFAKVLSKSYGYSSGIGARPIKTNIDGKDDITQEPMYLVRSGTMYLGNQELSSLGFNGTYWSSIVRSDIISYYLTFGGENIYPATHNGYHKYDGASVRCIAE